MYLTEASGVNMERYRLDMKRLAKPEWAFRDDELLPGEQRFRSPTLAGPDRDGTRHDQGLSSFVRERDHDPEA